MFLLSRMAALQVISYALPVPGRLARQMVVFRSVLSCCLTAKTYVYPLECCCYHVHRISIRHFISASGSRPPSLIFRPPWRRPVLTVVPLCCSMQKICGFRWNFPSYIYSLCNVRFKYFMFYVRHFDFRLNSHWIVHSDDFGILINKHSNVEIVSKVDLRFLIQWSQSLSHFHQEIIHTTFTSGDVIR